MDGIFESGWMNCIDESMYQWINRFTSPTMGIFLSSKPWPFGNEWHTICCYLYGRLLQCELFEGKADRPNGEMGRVFY